MIQNDARGLVSCQVSWMVRGTLTYSAATGLNGALIIEHNETHIFICLFGRGKNQEETIWNL